MGEADMVSPILPALDQIERTVKASKTYIAGARDLTYGTLFDRVARLSTLFRRIGLGPDDRAVISSKDDLSLVTLFVALVRNGITAVVLDPDAPMAELRKLVEAADAKALFLDAERATAADLQGVLRPEAVVTPIGDGAAKRSLFSGFGKKPNGAAASFPALLAECEPSAPRADGVFDSTTAYILFTSGTTSRPKGVEITHRNLHAQMQTFIRHYGLGEQSRLMNLLPLHHTDGLTHGAFVSLLAGMTLYRPWRFSVDVLPLVVDGIYKHRITHFITVPSVLSLIANLGDDYLDSFTTPDLKFIISTAAYLDENLWRSFEQRYRVRIVNVYGLTESVCESLYCGPDEATRKLGTIGKPIDSEARIVDEGGTVVPAGATGELCLRGAHIMKGYFRMPEETAKVLKDGWFHTGDLAWQDEEGFFHIVGRKKDVIITGGVNVYPEDVTGVLRSLPGVLDAVTFGLPDATWGEKVVACVLPIPGATLSVETLAKEFLERAARQKLPKEIHILDEFPRGPAGKVVSALVKKKVEELNAKPTAAAGSTSGSAEQRIIRIAARSFKTEAETLSMRSDAENTKGWNSLAHVEFLLGLEQEFGLRMSPQDIMNIRSLGDALNVVVQRAS
jgi:long-chain acyl-CoA synthetase